MLCTWFGRLSGCWGMAKRTAEAFWTVTLRIGGTVPALARRSLMRLQGSGPKGGAVIGFAGGAVVGRALRA
jgi:hypothetical protein